jgi:shikimate dehydrogenase
MPKPKTYWADTEFYALLGNPTRESLSAAMHNANFESLGMNALYTPYDVDDDGKAKVFSALEALRFKGLNVTMPLKQKVLPYLDETDEIGGLCDAVNTLYWKNGRLCGTNTDGFGFVHALKEQGHYDPAGKRCLMFGSGGAARGVAFALSNAGVGFIAISGRASDAGQIAKLAADLNAHRTGVCGVQSTDPDAVGRLLRESDLVVNTTPVGMAPDVEATPFDTSLLEKRHRVCDVVYVPHDTKLLREARARGCETLAGYWMMIWQGVEAFRRWTGGTEPNVEAMTRAVLENLKNGA